MKTIQLVQNSEYSEEFNKIKTNIKYSTVGKDKKVILITSSNSNEGKTTIACNLAVSLSMDNKRVVLVDCDLRKPSVHKEFAISKMNGLTDVLIEDIELSDALEIYNKNLDILTSGRIPPNPTELLASDQMDVILNELKSRYDYVLIDTTPLEVVADAQILSSKVDGTVLVCNYGKTKRDELINSKKSIDQVNGKVIGVILNRSKVKKGSYY